MKKKFKIAIATMMLGIASFAGYTAYETATMTDAERMMMENIEALTSGESDEFKNGRWSWCSSFTSQQGCETYNGVNCSGTVWCP